MPRQVKAWRKLIWTWQWRNTWLPQHLFAAKLKWLFMIPTVPALKSAARALTSAELLCGLGFSGNHEQDASQMFCCSKINDNRLFFWLLKSKNTIWAKALWIISNTLKKLAFLFLNYTSESNSVGTGPPAGDQVWAFSYRMPRLKKHWFSFGRASCSHQLKWSACSFRLRRLSWILFCSTVICPYKASLCTVPHSSVCGKVFFSTVLRSFHFTKELFKIKKKNTPPKPNK